MWVRVIEHLYSVIVWDEPIAKALRYDPCWQGDHTVLPATHSRTIPAFTPQPQSITTLWLVLTAAFHGGMARLSWHGCWQPIEISLRFAISPSKRSALCAYVTANAAYATAATSGSRMIKRYTNRRYFALLYLMMLSAVDNFFVNTY